MCEFIKGEAIKDYYDDILKLNDELVELLSPMNFERMKMLEGLCDVFSVVLYKNQFAGFLMALSEGKDYDSVNYKWFMNNYKNFLYIDRIVIDNKFQHLGIGTKLYMELFEDARSKKFDYVTAEINSVPPNEQSLGFHKKLGFSSVGEEKIAENKCVSMQLKKL